MNIIGVIVPRYWNASELRPEPLVFVRILQQISLYACHKYLGADQYRAEQ
jgi:hypothetical protein